LIHVTYDRVENRQEWKGHVEIKLFLDEFKEAWKNFLGNLEEPYKSKFDGEIAEKGKDGSEFQGLDLR
ncbi:MAG: hypothetical protein AB1631_30150, partial [Acidobacteriota bacterium]